MASKEYKKWTGSANKDNLEYYSSKLFQLDYTQVEMERKARMFQRRSLNEVRAVLIAILHCTISNKIRILSLGCGPGSDLLGILEALDFVLKSKEFRNRWSNRELTCECIGVDAFEWDRRLFNERVNQIFTDSVIGPITYQFEHNDMHSFVHDPTTENGLINEKFDFIGLSFADAGRNLELIGTALPQLLSEFGRILVLDKNIPTVRSLSDYGFTCTSSNRNVCMQSRDWGPAAPSHARYQPEINSPYFQFLLKQLESLVLKFSQYRRSIMGQRAELR